MSSGFVSVRLEKLEGQGQEWGEASGVPRVQIVIRHLLSGVIQVQRDVQVEMSSRHAGLKVAEREMTCTGFLGSPAHVVLKSTDVAGVKTGGTQETRQDILRRAGKERRQTKNKNPWCSCACKPLSSRPLTECAVWWTFSFSLGSPTWLQAQPQSKQVQSPRQQE